MTTTTHRAPAQHGVPAAETHAAPPARIRRGCGNHPGTGRELRRVGEAAPPRPPGRAPGASTGRGGSGATRAAATRGRYTVKVEPRPGSLRSVMEPPIIFAKRFVPCQRPLRKPTIFGDHGFGMTLSKRIPEMIGMHLRPRLERWLAKQACQKPTAT